MYVLSTKDVNELEQAVGRVQNHQSDCLSRSILALIREARHYRAVHVQVLAALQNAQAHAPCPMYEQAINALTGKG